MTLTDLDIALPAFVAGAGIGVALMVWRYWRSDEAAREYWADVRKGLQARNASLQASLDDAHREVSRLTGEKHARDTVIHQGIEVLQSLHRQGENGGE